MYQKGDDEMGKKIILEEVEEPRHERKSFTASHIMLYIVLGVYIVVALTGIIFVGACVVNGNYESGAQGLITVGSIIGACSCTAVGFYSTKAAKENEIKLSNDKYRMRLEITKDIFKEYGNTLDDRSIDLFRKLASDKDTSEIPPMQEQYHTDDWQSKMPKVEITPLNNIENDEGVG